MSRWERWSFNVLLGAVTATGVLYFGMKYVLSPSDPFAVINHPWQPAMIALHIVAAPVLVAFFGMIFRSHTLSKLKSRVAANRRSGWFSIVSFGAMALSGYLLQIASSPAWIDVMVWVHVIASTIFVTAYGVHLFTGRPIRRSSQIRAKPMGRAARVSL